MFECSSEISFQYTYLSPLLDILCLFLHFAFFPLTMYLEGYVRAVHRNIIFISSWSCRTSHCVCGYATVYAAGLLLTGIVAVPRPLLLRQSSNELFRILPPCLWERFLGQSPAAVPLRVTAPQTPQPSVRHRNANSGLRTAFSDLASFLSPNLLLRTWIHNLNSSCEAIWEDSFQLSCLYHTGKPAEASRSANRHTSSRPNSYVLQMRKSRLGSGRLFAEDRIT